MDESIMATHAMEYYVVVKNNKLLLHRSKFLKTQLKLWERSRSENYFQYISIYVNHPVEFFYIYEQYIEYMC